jgi:hypothetical protein
MGVSFDLVAYLFAAAGRTVYLLVFGVMHHLQKPTPLAVDSTEYLALVQATLHLRV